MRSPSRNSFPCWRTAPVSAVRRSSQLCVVARERRCQKRVNVDPANGWAKGVPAELAEKTCIFVRKSGLTKNGRARPAITIWACALTKLARISTLTGWCLRSNVAAAHARCRYRRGERSAKREVRREFTSSAAGDDHCGEGSVRDVSRTGDPRAPQSSIGMSPHLRGAPHRAAREQTWR